MKIRYIKGRQLTLDTCIWLYSSYLLARSAESTHTPYQSIGLYETWLNQGVANANVFISLVSQRMFGMFVQNQNTDANYSNLARCYSVYANYRFQPYLNLIHIDFVLLSCFRVSANRHDIETGKLKQTSSSYVK